MRSQVRRRILISLIALGALLVVLAGGFYIYTLDYYRADSDAVRLVAEDARVIREGQLTVFYPETEDASTTGLIFYPGGKVEDIAYAPLLKALSDNNITCVLIKMPFNLAVFRINGANRVYDQFPEIEHWYLAGHSLGGAMASSYCGGNADRLDGLILLGAYPVNDADLPTLAIYGSEDIRLDLERLENTLNKFEIEGGNHAYFGNYGEQAGDGTASISRQLQQEITVELMREFMRGQ